MSLSKNPRLAGRESVAENPTDDLQLHSIEAARARLGNIGRTWIYQQIKERGIRVVKLGRRTLIPHSELQRLVAECTEESSSDHRDAKV